MTEEKEGRAQEREVAVAEMAEELGTNTVKADWGVLENKSIEK